MSVAAAAVTTACNSSNSMQQHGSSSPGGHNRLQPISDPDRLRQQRSKLKLALCVRSPAAMAEVGDAVASEYMAAMAEQPTGTQLEDTDCY